MNMSDEDSEPTASRREHTKRPPRRFVVAAVAAVVVLACAGIAAYYLRKPPIAIPRDVTAAVTFPIYLPKQLPAGYKLDKDSFKYVAGTEHVLVFQAADEAGDTLVFAEQAKPNNVNFNDFAQNQLINAKKLPNVPHPTTVGQTLDRETTLVSTVTDKTWVVVTTQAEFDNQQLRDLAAGLHEY